MIYNTQHRIKTRWLSHLWCWCSGFLYFVAIIIEIVPWQVRWWWMCQRPQFHPQFTMSKHNKMQLNDSSLIIINIYIQYTVYIHIYIMHSSKHSQPCLLVRGLQSLSSVGHHVSRVEAGTEGRTGDLSVTPSWSSSLPAAEKKQPATFRATQVAQSVHTLLIKLELAVTKTVGQTRRSYILNLNYFSAPSNSTASSNEGGSDVTLSEFFAQILQLQFICGHFEEPYFES